MSQNVKQNVKVDSGYLQDIADAIRTKGSTQGITYTPGDMANAILNLPEGGRSQNPIFVFDNIEEMKTRAAIELKQADPQHRIAYDAYITSSSFPYSLGDVTNFVSFSEYFSIPISDYNNIVDKISQLGASSYELDLNQIDFNGYADQHHAPYYKPQSRLLIDIPIPGEMTLDLLLIGTDYIPDTGMGTGSLDIGYKLELVTTTEAIFHITGFQNDNIYTPGLKSTCQWYNNILPTPTPGPTPSPMDHDWVYYLPGFFYDDRSPDVKLDDSVFLPLLAMINEDITYYLRMIDAVDQQGMYNYGFVDYIYPNKLPAPTTAIIDTSITGIGYKITSDGTYIDYSLINFSAQSNLDEFCRYYTSFKIDLASLPVSNSYSFQQSLNKQMPNLATFSIYNADNYHSSNEQKPFGIDISNICTNVEYIIFHHFTNYTISSSIQPLVNMTVLLGNLTNIYLFGVDFLNNYSSGCIYDLYSLLSSQVYSSRFSYQSISRILFMLYRLGENNNNIQRKVRPFICSGNFSETNLPQWFTTNPIYKLLRLDNWTWE